MKQYDVIVLTDSRYLQDSSTDAYKHNVYYEDFILREQLAQLGLKTKRLAWDDPYFNWNDTKSILFRSTWDYFDRFLEFSLWLEKVKKQTILINSASIINWNLDKHYLADLRFRNIPIPETVFIERKTTKSLRQIHDELGWQHTVIKPCVGGAARHTYALHSDNLEEYESVFSKIIAEESMMLQPFQKSITTKGEVSFMVMNSTFTHAILKIAKDGDFRVQDDFGGSVHEYKANPEEIKFAENAVRACPELPIYARVDVIEDNNGKLAVSELELVEPELWFRFHPQAARELASGIKFHLNL